MPPRRKKEYRTACKDRTSDVARYAREPHCSACGCRSADATRPEARARRGPSSGQRAVAPSQGRAVAACAAAVLAVARAKGGVAANAWFLRAGSAVCVESS